MSDSDTTVKPLTGEEYLALNISGRMDALEAKLDSEIDKVIGIKSSLAEVGTMLDDIEARATRGHFSCPIKRKYNAI